jgi:hypothetical protein
MKTAMVLILALCSSPVFAKTWICTNQSESSEQKYPSRIAVNINEKTASIKALAVDPDGSSIATVGQTYKAERMDSSDEGKYKVPTFVVHDGEKLNGEYTYFGTDERDSDILMFVKPDQELIFWLHYNGGDYVGVDRDVFKCK